MEIHDGVLSEDSPNDQEVSVRNVYSLIILTGDLNLQGKKCAAGLLRYLHCTLLFKIENMAYAYMYGSIFSGS